MSIHSVSLHFLMALSQVEKLSGQFLSLGRQTVYIDPSRLALILEAYGHFIPDSYRLDDALNIDKATRNSKRSIRDDVLFSIFSDVDYKCLDKSDYEGAQGVLNLNGVIPHGHRQKYDFIYDGGTPDNVFDPAQAIRNICEMLAPGGRVLNFNVGGAWPGAYCSFSCEWFFSFYAVNDFEDVRVFLAVPVEDEDSVWPDPRFRLYAYSPFFSRRADYDPLLAARLATPIGAFVIATARKGRSTTVDRIPTQSHYLDAQEIDWREKYHNYSRLAPLPLRFESRSSATVIQNVLPFLSDHYSFVGVL
jgi:hypothetical protein